MSTKRSLSLLTPTPTPTLLHRFRTLLLRALLRVLRLFSPSIDRLLTRLAASPGLPVSGPSEAFWQIPRAPIAEWGSGEEGVPHYADVVVLGSGITGTAVVRTLLDSWREYGEDGELRVVMLEAREACSGATGRNGGHITPILYDQYPDLKASFGADRAVEIIRFRLAHLPALLEVAREEGLLEDSQCRSVDAFDVFLDKEQFIESKRKLEEYVRELPEESKEYRVREGRQVIEELELGGDTAGCISTRAGAVHPYRLVTGILSRLLREYSSTFRLFTRTPCTAISVSVAGDEKSEGELYEVTTPRGTIRTPHVVHATNGWAAHLLPGMRGRIVPARGTMTAQSVRNGKWAGERSFVFFPERGTHVYDYLTQQRVGGGSGYPSPEGEMMLGGWQGNAIEEMGNADDAGWDEGSRNYLSGALRKYFVAGETGVKRVWSGVLGVSVDGQPWVGRIPEVVAGRRAPRGIRGAGEWIAAGYSGEGMVHAWLSGKAVAHMVLGHSSSGKSRPDSGCVPAVYRVDEKRWANTSIEDWVTWFVNTLIV